MTENREYTASDYDAALVRALDAGDRALEQDNARLLRLAVAAVFTIMDRGGCSPGAVELALHRLRQLARRCPDSRERDELLARADVLTGPTGTA